jgi:hypothetical protein
MPEDRATALARGLLQIADAAGMPDTFWQSDSRVRLAREVLGIPEDGRYTHAHLWTELETRPAARGDVPAVEVIPAGGGWQVRCAVHGYLGSPAGRVYEDHGKARMAATRHRNRHMRGEDG